MLEATGPKLTKVCKTCTNILPVREFRPGRNACRSCAKVEYTARFLTPRGRAGKMVAESKTRSKRRGYTDHSVSIEYVTACILEGCAATGLKFDLSAPAKGKVYNMLAPSLDRIDITLGYTVENTQVVCWWYNMAKGQMTDEETFEFISIAYRNMNYGST